MSEPRTIEGCALELISFGTRLALELPTVIGNTHALHAQLSPIYSYDSLSGRTRAISNSCAIIRKNIDRAEALLAEMATLNKEETSA